MKVESAVVDGDSVLLSVRVPIAELFNGAVKPEQLPVSPPKKLPNPLKPRKPGKPRVPFDEIPREEDEEEEEIGDDPEDEEEALTEKIVKASKINDALVKIEESLGILDERCKIVFSVIQAGKQERPEICKAAKIPYSSLSPVLIKLEQKGLIKKTGFGKFEAVSK